jgi:hypothetical protein
MAPPAAVVAAPSPVPARVNNDLPRRSEWEPPRRRNIDANNPYGDDK